MSARDGALGWSLPRVLAAGAIALALQVPLHVSAQQPVSSCERCHEDEARIEHGRPHGRGGVSCTDCHGGDATQDTKEAAKAPGTGYRGALHGVAIVTLCGDCHADIERMNPSGLPTDQLAQYRTSGHGKALFGGEDEDAATCASCHGAHGILGPASSESPVHPSNVPATCGACHGDEDRMGPHSLDADIPAAYRASVHAAYLLDKGDASAPECATCHGSHGAVPPGVSSVSAVCGRCHVRERELFDKSPHAPLVEEGEFDGCETCHGNHEVREAGPALLENTCELCHSGQGPGRDARDRILATLSSARALLASTDQELRSAEQLGLVTEEDQLSLQEGRTAIRRAQVDLHGMEPAVVERAADEARTLLEGLAQRLEGERQEARRRRLAVAPVVAFLFLMSLGFWIRYRRIHGLT